MPAAFDRSKPVIGDTRALVVSETLENLVAIWLNTIGGGDGSLNWSYAVTAGANEQPTQVTLSSGTLRVRATITWGHTGNYYPTAITLAYSTNSGSSYDAAHASFTFGYTSGAVTSGNVGSLVLAWVARVWGGLKELSAAVTAHIAGTGTAVHGLGSMSTQAASAVAVTGGTINGTAIGSSSPSSVASTWLAEVHTAVAFGGATTTLNCNLGGSFSFTATGSGAATLAFSNAPSANANRAFIVEITNGGLRTWTWPSGTRWSGGAAPALSASGTDILTFYTRDGGTNWRAGLYHKGSA